MNIIDSIVNITGLDPNVHGALLAFFAVLVSMFLLVNILDLLSFLFKWIGGIR